MLQGYPYSVLWYAFFFVALQVLQFSSNHGPDILYLQYNYNYNYSYLVHASNYWDAWCLLLSENLQKDITFEGRVA